MKGHGSKFTRKMEEAVAALLTQKNFEEAARAVGISPATLLRWQKQTEFQHAYRDARRAAFGQSIGKLQHMSSAAVSVLGKVMVDAGTPASTKVRAAEAILIHGAKAIEIEDLGARVAELERMAKESKE
jgi:transposase-like protein